MIMVHGAPIAVIGPPLLRLLLSLLGFSTIFWVIDGSGYGDALVVSGSSLLRSASTARTGSAARSWRSPRRRSGSGCWRS